MPKVFVSIGSNIEPERNIRAGLRAMQQRFGPLDLSSVYKSEAVGFEGDAFLNLVAAFDSEESVEAIDQALDDIEQANGRVRGQQKFTSRTLDLDLTLYGDLIIDDGNLQLPRDEIARYAFVLEPLAELAGELHHPVLGKPYAELWDAFDKRGVQQQRVPFTF